MLTSLYFLSCAKECHDRCSKHCPPGSHTDDKPMNKALAFFLLALALALFIMEVVVLVYAIRIAVACSEPGANRVTHVVLAVFFTIPYLLFSLFLAPCHKKA